MSPGGREPLGGSQDETESPKPRWCQSAVLGAPRSHAVAGVVIGAFGFGWRCCSGIGSRWGSAASSGARPSRLRCSRGGGRGEQREAEAPPEAPASAVERVVVARHRGPPGAVPAVASAAAAGPRVSRVGPVGEFRVLKFSRVGSGGSPAVARGWGPRGYPACSVSPVQCRMRSVTIRSVARVQYELGALRTQH